METRYLNLKELCEYASLTPAGIYWLVFKRQIPFIKLTTASKSRLCFDKLEIDKWLKKRAITFKQIDRDS